jgi:hypothetical protein
MGIVGRIILKIEEKYNPHTKFIVKIDRIGIGTGPLSRLKEIIKEREWKNVRIVGCHFGESPEREEFKAHYRNKKGQNYFRLQALFNEGMIKIIDKKELTTQLLQMKWKLSSTGKREVVDPDKSPDFADSLVYFTWDDQSEMAFGFIPTNVK